ncbi:hypothetical protein AYI69_g9296, partial [Smittium culicis]|jgi:hypothetical protein
MFAKI